MHHNRARSAELGQHPFSLVGKMRIRSKARGPDHRVGTVESLPSCQVSHTQAENAAPWEFVPEWPVGALWGGVRDLCRALLPRLHRVAVALEPGPVLRVSAPTGTQEAGRGWTRGGGGRCPAGGRFCVGLPAHRSHSVARPRVRGQSPGPTP